MKLKIIAIALGLFAQPAFAQGFTNTSESASGSLSNSAVIVEGSEVPGNAPSVSAPSMSSGHPCAWTGFSAGISFIGGSATVGGQQIDDACMLGQMGYTNSAVFMIAARNEAACLALKKAGRVKSCVLEGDKTSGTVSSKSNAPTKTSQNVLRGCEMNGNRPRVTVASFATEAQTKAATAACMTKLGF